MYVCFMMDLTAVIALRAVETHGSVGAAAAALGFTPSAISQQVKRLERDTGVTLLERVGRGVMLTDHGRIVSEAGGRLLADLEAVDAELQRRTDVVAGHLRVAVFSTANRGLLAAVAQRLLAAHPDLRLSLRECEPWETVDLVATGLVEIGVVHTWGDVALEIPEHLVATSVAGDVADVIVRHDHPLAGRARVTPHDLLDAGWIATPAGTICRQWLHRMYDGTGRLPRIAHEALEFDSHLAMVRAGLGIALVPRLGRGVLGTELVAVPATDPEPTRDIVALHRRTMDRSPAVQAMLSALAAGPAVGRPSRPS